MYRPVPPQVDLPALPQPGLEPGERLVLRDIADAPDLRQGRDLGGVARDINAVLAEYRSKLGPGDSIAVPDGLTLHLKSGSGRQLMKTAVF